MTLVLLLAFGLRLHRLAYDSVWWDEGFSIWMARMPIRQMLFETANDAHPPLSYAVLHVWRALVGDEEFSLRVLSVFCGLLTVAVGYRIGQEVGGKRAGLAGALLIAVARLPVWWSQEVRMYAPATLFSALALWSALRLFASRRRSWLWATMLALSLGAGLLTLYLFIGVVLALNLAFVYAFWNSRQRWRLATVWVAAQAGGLALFVPWAIYALPYLPSWAAPQAPVGFQHVVKLYLSTIFLGIATSIERFLPFLILALVILTGAMLVTFIGSRGTRRTGWVTLMIGTLLPPVVVYLLSLPRGHFNYPTPSPRYFLLLSTPVYILLGWGIVMLNRWRRWIGTAALALLIGLGGWSLTNYYSGLRLTDDYISLAATLEALRQPNDAVILNNDTDWPIFAYHYPYPFERHISKTQRIVDDPYAAYLLSPYRQNNDGVWLVQTRYAEVTDPDNRLGNWLQQRSWNWRRYVFPEAQLWFYAMNPERGDPATVDLMVEHPTAFVPLEAPIADGVRLTGFTQVLPEVYAGDLLVVGLGWRIEGARGEEWPIALQLIGADGTEIASTLAPLRGRGDGERFQPIELFIPPDTPSGQARIVFVAGETWQPLGAVRIRARREEPSEAAEIPASATPVNVRFGDSIVLLAADLPEQTIWRPGEEIPLTLYWGAEGVIPERYKVFVHLSGEAYNPATNNTVWGQQDQEPNGGATPTTTWRPGLLIADDYLIPIREDAPPGQYTIQVGLYLPLDGRRLPVSDASGEPLGDSLTLLEVEIADR